MRRGRGACALGRPRRLQGNVARLELLPYSRVGDCVVCSIPWFFAITTGSCCVEFFRQLFKLFHRDEPRTAFTHTDSLNAFWVRSCLCYRQRRSVTLWTPHTDFRVSHTQPRLGDKSQIAAMRLYTFREALDYALACAPSGCHPTPVEVDRHTE